MQTKTLSIGSSYISHLKNVYMPQPLTFATMGFADRCDQHGLSDRTCDNAGRCVLEESQAASRPVAVTASSSSCRA